MRLTRLAASVVAVVVALAVPATASASVSTDRGQGSRDDDRGTSASTSAFWATASAEQKAAVGAARQAYVGSAWDIRVALREQMATVRSTQEAALDAPARSLALAKEAWVFAVQTGGDSTAAKAAYEKARTDYRAAADAARATARTGYDAARASAKSALDQAAAAYRAAVIAAFPAGTVIPDRVLAPVLARGGHGGDGRFGGRR